jgi:hypothetical protein
MLFLNNGTKVLVEFKNVTGKLNGKSLEQMQDYKKLIDAGKIDEVEYVFSSLEAAKENERLISDIFGSTGDAKLSYIDKAGKKISYTIR